MLFFTQMRVNVGKIGLSVLTQKTNCLIFYCISYIILCILTDFGKFCLFCTSFARFMDVFVQNFDVKSGFLRIMEKRICKI